MKEIKQTLQHLFEHHRVVFWYDSRKELRSRFDALDLPGIRKLELQNNQFGVKYRLLRREPDQKFLLYHEGPPPEPLEDWLLDVRLAHCQFRTDRRSLILSRLGLGPRYGDIVSRHGEFFRLPQRINLLKKRLVADDSLDSIRLKMLAVLAASENRLERILENLLQEAARENGDFFKGIRDCNLWDFLWQQVRDRLGYRTEHPGIEDFALQLFQSVYRRGMGLAARLNEDVLHFMTAWKDNRRHARSFETLSNRCQDALGIQKDLEERDYRNLTELDCFSLIDRKIVGGLANDIARRTISNNDALDLLRRRRNGHWYEKKFMNLYMAMEHAVRYYHLRDHMLPAMESRAEGFRRYAESWFRVDQHYRKYTVYMTRSGQPELLKALTQQMKDDYSAGFLQTLNDTWMRLPDPPEKVESEGVVPQERFYRHWVHPYPAKKKRVVVLFSDGLRFETADELMRYLLTGKKIKASLEAMLRQAPGHSLSGTVEPPANGTSTLQAEELLNMTKDQRKTRFMGHPVAFVHHKGFDWAAFGQKSDAQRFKAVEEYLAELRSIVKILMGIGPRNILVTAGHALPADKHHASGGSTLQDAVLPVLHVNRVDHKTVVQVDVEIFKGSSDIITTGQLGVTFYQCQPVEPNRPPRRLRAGLYADNEILISDRHLLDFDFTSAVKREREITRPFRLTREAENFNGRDVFLRLEERIDKTDTFRVYKTMRYRMRRSFTGDFDF
jgi:hypothetical protein